MSVLSTAKQRQELGYVRKLCGLDEDTYKEILMDTYRVESSKELTRWQIKQFINKLRDDAKQMGSFKPKKNFNFCKYNNLSNRQGMASPAQLRKIEAMWKDVSYQKTSEDREKALKAMIKRICDKDAMEFLTAKDVRKVIKAFENM